MTKSFLAIIAAVALAVVYMSTFVVSERQKALVLRFGDINRIVDLPGLYFKLPVAETVTMIEDRIMVWENDNRPVQDKDSQVYIVDAITLSRIKDARLFRETLGADLEQAQIRVGALLDAALRQTYGQRSFDQVLSADRSTMMLEISKQVRQEADRLGIDIVDVRVRRTDLDGAVLDSTYNRMKSERNALATKLRSEGEAVKTRMNAQTDRKYVVRVEEARRDAEIVKGQADATRNKVFATAFQQDTEFFSFYRSMQAYAKGLSGQGTTMVLKPDSDFFRYFGGNAAKDAAPAPAQ
jgi:modulator of FtsH protease HflC